MEECVVPLTQSAVNEDPDSRDSGISVGGFSVASASSSSSSSSNICSSLPREQNNRLGASGSSSSTSQATLINDIVNVLEISGRRSLTQDYNSHFFYSTPSLLQRSHSSTDVIEEFIEEDTLDEEAYERICAAKSPRRKKQRRAPGGPTDFSSLCKFPSLSHSAQNTSSSSTLHLNTSDNDIPPSARSIHRVHSASVLEVSAAQRSWGSPDALENYSLRTVERPQVPSRAFRSIDTDTMVQLLESMSAEQFARQFVLIDCRYPYEFAGGHILYSENIFEADEIIKLFYPEEDNQFSDMNQRIPIFYCEYSQKRGPKMAMALREHDRNRNENRYPYVDYKEIYLLDRGYRHFFKECQLTKFCEPAAYVQMWDPAHAEERKQFDGHRRNMKKRRRRP